VTQLRKKMLEELQRRNYAQSTAKQYIRIVREFANYYNKAPDQLGPDQIREYSAYLFRERKLDPGTVQQHVAGLRFFYVKTLKRHFLLEDLPMPKRSRRIPEILSPEEVARLIDSASNLFHRTMLMTLYSTGIRRAELCRLQVSDIDSERMVIHIRKGKGGHDRDVPLSEKLLETLRVYWRWMKPKNYLFPGTVKNWRSDVPVTTKLKSPGRLVERRPSELVLASMFPRTRYGTAMRRICSKPAPTYARFRFCWATLRLSTPLCTYTCRAGISPPSAIPWIRLKSPHPSK
jgi:integrase/recombinase XerD